MASVVLTLGRMVPGPALVVSPEQFAEHFARIQKDADAEIAVSVEHAVEAVTEEQAAQAVEDAVSELRASAESAGTRSVRLAAAAENVDKIKAAVSDLRAVLTVSKLTVKSSLKYELRALPKGAEGWWHNVPVFVVPVKEEITDFVVAEKG